MTDRPFSFGLGAIRQDIGRGGGGQLFAAMCESPVGLPDEMAPFCRILIGTNSRFAVF